MRCPHCGMPLYQFKAVDELGLTLRQLADMLEEDIASFENGDDPEEETE